MVYRKTRAWLFSDGLKRREKGERFKSPPTLGWLLGLLPLGSRRDELGRGVETGVGTELRAGRDVDARAVLLPADLEGLLVAVAVVVVEVDDDMDTGAVDEGLAGVLRVRDADLVSGLTVDSGKAIDRAGLATTRHDVNPPMD